ncbi:hypothetical protein MMC29_001298 [Sticta canariensis]|nr:hypothetical protein [Sticta canariensis]
MDTIPFCLTFGVELEFIVRYSPERYQDNLLVSEGKHGPIEKDISQTLHNKYGSLVRLDMIQLLNENGFVTNGLEDRDFSKWTVSTDFTVAPLDVRGDWYAIELKTPALVYSSAALEKIERVVKLLVSKFKIHTNESCGLHVHVGNEDRGFSLRTLKNFCSLITVFQDQLNSMHTVDRLHNNFLQSSSRAFHISSSTKGKLSIINELKTVDHLIERFHKADDDDDYDTNTTVNFYNLHQGFAEPLQTIEFRQHRGTLDPKLITNWVMVVCNLVNTSHVDKAGFHDLIENHIDDTKYTVIDLFKDLELSELAEFYGPLVFGTDQNPAVEAEFVDGFMTVSSPGKYDTQWEKEFTPRPPDELAPYRWNKEGWLNDLISPQSEPLLEEGSQED